MWEKLRDIGLKFHSYSQKFKLSLTLDRSSHQRCSTNKAVLKNSAIFTGKHLCWFQACIFIKKRLQHRCFPVNTAEFLGTPILKTSANGCFWLDKFKAKNDVIGEQLSLIRNIQYPGNNTTTVIESRSF